MHAGQVLVYQVPNTPPAGEAADPGMSEQDLGVDFGAISVPVAIALFLLVLILLIVAGVISV